MNRRTRKVSIGRLSYFLCLTLLPAVFVSGAAASSLTETIEKGRELFKDSCAICHTIGGGDKTGRDLKGVTSRREKDWLFNIISDPEKMIKAGDPIAIRLLKESNNIVMPTLWLSRDEIAAILSYIENETPSGYAGIQAKERNKAAFDFSSRTYMQLHEDTKGSRYAPLYNYIELELTNMKRGQFNFYSAGWVKYDMKTSTDRYRERDELTYAYLNYSPFEDRRLTVNVGRQIVFEGLASEQIDGIFTRWEFTPQTGMSLFYGIPVETESDGRKADLIYGSRIFKRVQDRAEVGLSFLKETNAGKRYREEAGMDLWLLLTDKVEFQGYSSFNNLTHGWMEQIYNIRFSPGRELSMTGLFSHTDYNNTFSKTTLSAFSPEYAGINEKLTKTGISAEYKPGKALTSVFDITRYEYKNSGSAIYYGAKLVKRLFDASVGASLHRMEGKTIKLRYTEARLYAAMRVKRFDLSVDTINLHYDSPYNNLRNAYNISGTIAYALNYSLSMSLTFDHGKDPDFSSNTKALLAIIYNRNSKPVVRQYL